MLKFSAYNGDPAIWGFVDGSETPLSGPDADSITYSATTILPYNGDSIVYMPVPYEMLRTHHSNPQIVMTVDSLPVGCRAVDCDYLYEDPAPSVSGFNVAGENSGDQMTITGTDFPSELVAINFADTFCEVTSISTT